MIALPKAIVLSACLALLAACGSSRPSHFYLLTPLAAGEFEHPPAATPGPGLLVGPVTLPEYLLRPQLVLRNRANQIRFEEFHRWAEPLHGNFSRVLAENLSRLLNNPRVIPYPGYRTADLPYQVVVDVSRMDVCDDRRVEFTAHWSILDRRNHSLLRSARNTFVEPMADESHAAMVAAQSRTVARLAETIARALETLSAD